MSWIEWGGAGGGRVCWIGSDLSGGLSRHVSPGGGREVGDELGWICDLVE